MLPMSAAKPAGSLLLILLSLALGACLFSPGKFVSSLDVRQNGMFTYTYTGEIYFLALSKLAEMGETGSATFEAKPCYNDGTGHEKPCTGTELADQKSAWESEHKTGSERHKRDAESMKAVFGGIDMSDPRAAEEVAARLRRQAGWRRVTYKGDGLFDVDFAITGTLDHDFAFPTVEQFPMANAFIQISRRKDGVVRIDASGFGPATGGNPLQSFSKMALPASEKSPGLPAPDGRFTLTTDAVILANNTDEGPRPGTTGHQLDWIVNLRSAAAPMALVRLVQRP